MVHTQEPSPIQLGSNLLQPVTTAIQEAASKNNMFTQRGMTGRSYREEPIEDKLEESEAEALLGTLEVIRPTPETFDQKALQGRQLSPIPCPHKPPPNHPPPNPPTPWWQQQCQMQQNGAAPPTHPHITGPSHAPPPEPPPPGTAPHTTNP